jgi:hypothetical protein
MKGDAVEQVRDTSEATGGVFEGDAADESMNFIAEGEEVFGEIAAVLAGDTCD